MNDVDMEPHSDRVGGNDVIDIAILIHLHLGIAGAWRQRAEDDGRAAALAPDPFGDRIYILDGKGDDRAAARKARARKNSGAGQKAAHGAVHGGGTDQQSLLAPAPV